MSAGQDEPHEALAVLDANEYKQKRRLKRLLEAREKVERKADEAEELFVSGQIDRHARNTMVLRAVREYIREGWPLLLDHARERAEEGEKSEYLETRELGEVETTDGGRSYQGLYDILFCDAVFVEETEQRRHFRHGPDETVTETVKRSVPERVSWQAYLTMTEFLSDVHDLEMQFEGLDTGIDSFGFDTVEIGDVDAQAIEEIEAAIDAAVDARAVTDGGSDE